MHFAPRNRLFLIAFLFLIGFTSSILAEERIWQRRCITDVESDSLGH